MVLFFFYKNLTNCSLLNKINPIYDINDGYALIEKIDAYSENLEISN